MILEPSRRLATAASARVSKRPMALTRFDGPILLEGSSPLNGASTSSMSTPSIATASMIANGHQGCHQGRDGSPGSILSPAPLLSPPAQDSGLLASLRRAEPTSSCYPPLPQA